MKSICSKAYVINLRQHSDRRKNMTRLLQELKFKDFEFVTPVSLKTAATIDPTRSKERLSHALTYRGLLKRIEMRNEGAFIMEDDIERVHSAIETNKRLIDSLEEAQTDMLYFEYCFEKCHLIDTTRVYRMNAPMCAACIHFTPDGARKFLAKPMKSTWIDKDFRRMIQNKQLTAGGLLLFRQDPRFGSTLPDPVGFRALNPNSSYPICTRLSWPGLFRAKSMAAARLT